jgi:phenylpropionate dioxygenase-like ring-hydroxylating dioxygenase large terminal subunit
MNAPRRLELMRRLITLARAHRVLELEPRSTRLPVDRYLDPAQLDAERAALFRGLPLIAAHVSEIPEPGDFTTAEIGGVPIVALRDGEGEVRVFANVCRHRGARLLAGERGSCGKAITCPYHAWSYRLDGSLLHVPRDEVFAGLDRDALGLRAIDHQVRHGFVWARVEPDGPLEVDRFLGAELDGDLEAFGFADHRVERVEVSERAANWKLVMDAFAEGYHLKSLHRQSLARFFLEGSILDDLAPHVRQVGARKSLLEVADQGEDTWDLRRDTTVFYNLFPNAILVFHPEWISQMSLFPTAVDRVRVIHRMLVDARVELDPARLQKSFELIHHQVFEREDLMIAESIQSTLASGANHEVLLGGLEEGMRLFHAARDRALATLVERRGGRDRAT